ncbi:transcription intermediary factor 1-alpha-like isoform X2 [Limulus polyphemus]|uniref:Transcription intermediary factor 1-alpha-like isoform X2 n=1 Tax=Limulus polyphemus TaxID=6850 RepID=A0ABM1T487_LIMPO|nr:transcription intermediary factor 1-alpha-like isoform X2 [Limulus polyphemus]
MENNDNDSTPEIEQVSGNETPEWVDSKCVFCKQELKEGNEPRLLPCLHGACKACVSAESVPSPASVSNYSTPATKPVTCPSCKEEINPDSVIDHLFILENIAQANEALEGDDKKPPCCTSCEDSAPASGFCTDCQEWLCETCVQAHQRVKVTKDHSVRPRDEMEGEKTSGLDQKYLFCPVHSKEPLKLYCESCDKLTCRDCQLSEHKDHKYQFLSAACEQHKLYLSTLLTKIKEKQNYIENARSLISKRQDEVTEREKEVTQEIKMFAVKFITEINRRGKLLLQELNEVCSRKKKQLTMKNEELVSLSKRLHHCQQFADAVITKGSDIALVYSKKSLTGQLRHVLRRRCEVPNPQHMVDIKFAYESQFLSEYISHLGCLMVDQQPVGGLLPGGMGRGQQAVNPSMRMQAQVTANNQPVCTLSSERPKQRAWSGPRQPYKPRGMIPSQGVRPPPSYGNISGTGMAVRPRGHMMAQPPNKGYPQQQVSSSTHPNLAGHSPVQLRNLLSTSQQQVMSPRSNQTPANWQQRMPGNQVRGPSPQMAQQTRPYPVQLRQANPQTSSPSQVPPVSVAISLPVSLNSNITISPIKTSVVNNRQSQAQGQRPIVPRTNSQSNQQKSLPLSTPNLPPGLQILPHPAPRQPSPSQVIVIDDDPAPVTTSLSAHTRNMSNTSRLSHFPSEHASSVKRMNHQPSHDNRMHSSPVMHHIPNRPNGAPSTNTLPPYIVPATTINPVPSPIHRTTPDSVSLTTPPTTTVQSHDGTSGGSVLIKDEAKSPADQMPSCSIQGCPPKEESIVDAASRILSEFANQSIGSILKDEDKGTADEGSSEIKSKDDSISLTTRNEGRRGSTLAADSSSSPVPVVTIDDDPVPEPPTSNPIIVSVTSGIESVFTTEDTPVKETNVEDKPANSGEDSDKTNSSKEDEVEKSNEDNKELDKRESDEDSKRESQETTRTEPEEVNRRDSQDTNCSESQDTSKGDSSESSRKEFKEINRRDSEEETRKDVGEKSRTESQGTVRRISNESSSSSEKILKVKIKKEKLDDMMLPIVKIKKEKIDDSPKEINNENPSSEDSSRSLLDDLQSLEDLLKTSSSGLTVSEVRVNSSGLEISKVEMKPSSEEKPPPVKDAVAVITKTLINGKEEKQLSTSDKKTTEKTHHQDDPNEDWCAVCHDGGELLCCSNCPRVYHLNCHVPALLTTPNEDWACLMCTDVINASFLRESSGSKRKNPVGLSGRDLLCCEKILLELLCHEASLPFHEPVSKTQVPNYYKVITKPMDLLTIKQKLSPNHFNHYEDDEEFISDTRLIFSNCFVFNPEGSTLYNAGKIIEAYFCDLIKKYLPEKTFEMKTQLAETKDSTSSDGETNKAKRQRKDSSDNSPTEY